MKEYYYIKPDNSTAGPVPGEQLQANGVTAKTYVWNKDLGSQWLPAGDVPELKPLFAAPQRPAAPSFRPPQGPQAPQTPRAGSFGGQGSTTGIRPGAFPGAQGGAQRPASPQQPYAPQQPQQPYGGQQPQQPYGGQQPQQPYGGQQPQQPYAPQPQQPYAPQPQQPYAPKQPQQPYGAQRPYAPQQPQQPYGGAPQPQFNNQGYNPGTIKPDNYLVWAILSTVLCCIPTGVVSIVYATKVDSLWNSGQYAEAQKASNNAKTWAIVSAGAGLLFSIIYAIILVAAS